MTTIPHLGMLAAVPKYAGLSNLPKGGSVDSTPFGKGPWVGKLKTNDIKHESSD